jgi:hypothetical protein
VDIEAIITAVGVRDAIMGVPATAADQATLGVDSGPRKKRSPVWSGIWKICARKLGLSKSISLA